MKIAAPPWMKDGVAYFIFNVGLVEAKTGKVKWKIDQGAASTGPSVWGDLLVLSNLGGNAQKRSDGDKPENWPKMGMPVFRITPEKCEKI